MGAGDICKVVLMSLALVGVAAGFSSTKVNYQFLTLESQARSFDGKHIIKCFVIMMAHVFKEATREVYQSEQWAAEEMANVLDKLKDAREKLR